MVTSVMAVTSIIVTSGKHKEHGDQCQYFCEYHTVLFLKVE